jgi:hypothetical protein
MIIYSIPFNKLSFQKILSTGQFSFFMYRTFYTCVASSQCYLIHVLFFFAYLFLYSFIQFYRTELILLFYDQIFFVVARSFLYLMFWCWRRSFIWWRIFCLRNAPGSCSLSLRIQSQERVATIVRMLSAYPFSRSYLNPVRSRNWPETLLFLRYRVQTRKHDTVVLVKFAVQY